MKRKRVLDRFFDDMPLWLLTCVFFVLFLPDIVRDWWYNLWHHHD